MDNRGRSKLFGCFKSAARDDSPKTQAASPPPPSDDDTARKRRTPFRAFSSSLKSALFKSPLMTKLKNKKQPRRDPFRSGNNNNSIPSKLKKPAKRLIKPVRKLGISNAGANDTLDDESDRGSLFSSTSSNSAASSFSSSSSSSSPKRSSSCLDLKQGGAPNNDNRRKAMKLRGGGKCFNYCTSGSALAVICVVFACLMALVFSGKVCAVMTCTSAWLALAHGRRAGAAAAANNVVDSGVEKQRVVMRGLLERHGRRATVV